MVKELFLLSALVITPQQANTETRGEYSIQSNTVTTDYSYSMFNEVDDESVEKYENGGYGAFSISVNRKVEVADETKPILNDESEPVLDSEGQPTYETKTVLVPVAEDEEWLKGDIVTVSLTGLNTTVNYFYDFSANVYCNTEMISITKETLTSFKFTFDTVGTYEIKGGWVLSNSAYKKLLDIGDDALQGNWSSVFSIQNLVLLIYGIILVVMFISNNLLGKKSFSKLGTSLANRLGIDTNASVEKNIANVASTLQTTLTQIQSITEKSEAQTLATKEAMKKFVQAFLYMQENTPESKQALINLLSTLNLSSDEDTQKIVEEVLAKLQNDKETKEIQQQETAKQIAELKETVAIEEETKVEEETTPRPLE